MDAKEFYDEVARLLETENDYHEPPRVHGGGRLRHDGTIRNTYKTRWNGREPGNGRFPRHGLVRFYSEECIHVTLSDPPLSGIYGTVNEALEAIERALGESLTKQANAEIDELLDNRLGDRWIDRYREKIREANEKARQVVRAAGVTLDPRIAALKAKQEDRDDDEIDC